MPIDRAATFKNAEKLLQQGKLDLAIAEYVRIVEEDPRDWNTGNVLGDLYVRARKVDQAIEQFVRIAEGLASQGFLPKAGALYKKILKIKPDDEHALLQGAEVCATQGLLADARVYLNTVLKQRRSRGDDRGVAHIKIRLGSIDPEDLDARFEAARARMQIQDFQGALHEFKELAAELSGLGREAEAIEALREAARLDPEDNELRIRLARALAATGDMDAEAEYLAVEAERTESPGASSRGAALHFELGPNSIDLGDLIGEIETTSTSVRGQSENVEVDLVELDDVDNSPSGHPAQSREESADLETVFAALRDDASRRKALEGAEKEYERGLKLQKAGRVDECIPAFEAASRAPRLRFVSASALGRIYRERGNVQQAVEYLERAALAPPPSAEEGHRLLYELADILESIGEQERALAIFLELQADAGGYRDVLARVSRLSKAQARG